MDIYRVYTTPTDFYQVSEIKDQKPFEFSKQFKRIIESGAQSLDGINPFILDGVVSNVLSNPFFRSYGFMVNKDIKDTFSEFKLGHSIFFDISVLDKIDQFKKLDGYYYLHVGDVMPCIDYQKTTFKLVDHIDEKIEKTIVINDAQDYRRQLNEVEDPETGDWQIEPYELVLTEKMDLFKLPLFARIYCTSALKERLQTVAENLSFKATGWKMVV